MTLQELEEKLQALIAEGNKFEARRMRNHILSIANEFKVEYVKEKYENLTI